MRIDLSNGTFFKTKTEATKFFKFMLNKCGEGSRVAPDDARDLLALLERHPSAEQKIGCGVTHFTRQKTPFGSRGFYLHRKDGSSTDFSYRMCIKGSGATFEQKFAACARETVAEDVQTFKRNAFASGTATCAISGLEICNGEVHHSPVPFRDIVKRFLKENPCGPEVIQPSADNQIVYGFCCQETARKFREFHRQFPLEIVSPELHNRGTK
jgi:hypothetical protein